VYKLRIAKIRPPKELRALLSRFDLVILQSSPFEPIAITTVLALKSTDTETLMLVDNWDNLSSKTVLWELPDYIATWGPQSSRHAIEIQGMPAEKVFEIGTARFSNHVAVRTTRPIQNMSYKYVLFVGTFLDFDEAACLKVINDEIEANPKIYGDLRVIYRPHPYKNYKENPCLECLNRVRLDSEILKQMGSKNLQPLDYAASLELQLGAQMVVGGLTSMLIEAGLLGKNFLSLVHHEKNNLTSPHTVYHSYEHFEGIDKLPNVYFSDDIEKLGQDFRFVYNQPNRTQAEINSALSYFYHISTKKYSETLRDLVEDLMRNRQFTEK
jgi:hypothetical protein